MRVSSISVNNINQNKNMYKKNTYSNPIGVRSNYNSTSFGSVSVATGTLLQTRILLGLRKSMDKVQKIENFKASVYSVLNNIDENIDKLPGIIYQMAQVLETTDEKFMHKVFGKNDPEQKIKNLKDIILKKGLNALDDSNGSHRFVKKFYIEKTLLNNEDATLEFLEVFKNLDDNFYKNFKSEIVETILYSPNRVNKKDSANLEMNNYRIIKSLDPKIYSDVLSKNSDAINALNVRINNYVMKIFAANRNFAYESYCQGFDKNTIYNEEDIKGSDWKNNYAQVFNLILTAKSGNPEEQAKLLNIDTNYLKEIFLDICSINQAIITNKQDCLANRIKQKLESMQNEYPYINESKLRLIYADILTFIQKSNFKYEDYPNIKDKIEEIESRLYSMRNLEYFGDTGFDYENFDGAHML